MFQVNYPVNMPAGYILLSLKLRPFFSFFIKFFFIYLKAFLDIFQHWPTLRQLLLLCLSDALPAAAAATAMISHCQL